MSRVGIQGTRFSEKRVASQLNGASWFFQPRRRARNSDYAVAPRLKSGTDYTRLPPEARENMKVGLWEIGGRVRFGAVVRAVDEMRKLLQR